MPSTHEIKLLVCGCRAFFFLPMTTAQLHTNEISQLYAIMLFRLVLTKRLITCPVAVIQISCVPNTYIYIYRFLWSVWIVEGNRYNRLQVLGRSVASSDHDVAVLCKTPEIALTGVPKLLTTQQNGSLGTERVSMGARS